MSFLDVLAGLTPAAAVCLAVSLFSGSLIPFFLLVDADFTAVWQSLAAAGRSSREAFRDAAALILLLTTTPKGDLA